MEVVVSKPAESISGHFDVIVVLDVIRASSNILTLFSRGADFVVPVESLDEAKKIKSENPDFILFGERNRVRPEGFDYGNSPTQNSRLELFQRKAIISTTNGTKAITNAVRKADEVWIGGFLNVGAIVNALKRQNPEKVALLAASGGDARKNEDELCAKYLKALMIGENVSFHEYKDHILNERLKEKNLQSWFKADIEFCLQLNKYNFVPKVYSDLKYGNVIKI
ncbi:2-phosphosulfolactate phosphatase [Candidatus Altiarchaeota archaeon]